MEKKVLFLDTVHPILKESLEKDGYICEDDHQCSREALQEKIGDYFGLVLRSRLMLDRDTLGRAENLAFIARSGSGLENIDSAFADEKNIACFNSPEGNREAVGEHALGMLLDLLNNISKSNAGIRHGEWNREENRGTELGGKTVAIIGFGNTGDAFARKLKGFDCHVLAYDKFKTGFSTPYCEESDLDSLFPQADILSIHIPYNFDNQYFVNKSLIESFRKDIVLINTSRGAVLNTNDVVECMESGKITGICLDVFENEISSFEKLDTENNPVAFQYLLRSNRAVLTPHIAGWTVESYYKLSAVLYEKIRARFGVAK